MVQLGYLFSLTMAILLVRCSCRERRARSEGGIAPALHLRTARLSFGPTTLWPALRDRLAFVVETDREENHVTMNGMQGLFLAGHDGDGLERKEGSR